MPRRKVQPEEPFLEPVLALPRPKAKHEHEVDAYETLPSAVVTVKPSKTSTSTRPLDRKLTPAEIQAQKQAKLAQKELEQRHNFYLDTLYANGGDTDAALAIVFNITPEEAHVRRFELQTEVRRGLGSSSLAEELERNDLSLKARVGLLRKQAYSGVPAAVLKSIDMIGEMEGNRSGDGNFESFLRLAKEQRRK